MPSPSGSLASLRPELGSFMELDALALSRGYIGMQLFPVLEVGKQSGSFGKVTTESLLQSRDTTRAPGSGYNRQRWEFTEDTYACVEHGAEDPIDDREADMYADYFDAETIATLRARDVVLRNYETRVMAAAFDTTNGTVVDESAAPWDTPASGLPVTNVEAAIQALYSRGILANAVVMSWKVFRDARMCDEFQALISSEGAGSSQIPSRITERVMAEVFGVDHVLVGGKQKVTSNEGAATALSSIVSDDYCLVTRIAETNDIREPCIGRTFHWAQDGSTMGGQVESYRDETVRSDVIRARMDTDEKALFYDAIQLIQVDPL